ncbi:MAG: cyclic nucleotide-binding domain-containing protein, partial [Deltaproteobacteria bacterium]|nr:cyclic nucleotide-binding domain-containing protein [Deltaproteobacteria bacterium]
MTNSSTLGKAVDAIVFLNAAFINIRLYPPDSPMIMKSIENAYSILHGVFEQEDAVIFSESEGSLVISGQVMDEKDSKRPQVISFVQLMLKHGIKRIIFKKGLEKSELLHFLEAAAGKPEDVQKEGGVQKVISGAGIKNILVNQNKEDGTDEGDTKGSHEQASAERGQLEHIRSGIESIIKGRDEAFRDRLIMQALPKAVMDLMTHGKEKTADAIIRRLGDALLNKMEAVRGEASLAFARVGAHLLSEKRAADMIRHYPGLVNWIRVETIMLPAYKHIVQQMQLLSRHLIIKHRISEAMEIIKTFHMINTGELKKDESIKAVSADALKDIARDEILNSLEMDFQTDRDGLGKQAREILVMLGARPDKTIDAISGGPAYKDAGPGEKEEPVSPVVRDEIETEKKAHDDEYFQKLSQVEQYVTNNDAGSAVKLLFEMIVKYAGEKDFERADVLRDKLMETDSMALSEIIKSGEIIEEAKSKAIDKAHLNLWSELYKDLTEEETSTLFFALKSVRFKAGHAIFQKGDHDSRLYFINRGRIKLVYKDGDKEKILKELKQGDMLNEDAFFSLTLSTTTAITLTEVELNYLEKDVLSKWELRSYGIEPKLHDYYLRTKRIDETMEKMGSGLRRHERIPISGKVKVQFMDSSGIPCGEPVTGALSDISQGGMSFYLNIKKEKITKLFVEPRLNMKFSLMVGGSEQRFDQNGTMVAAIPHY